MRLKMKSAKTLLILIVCFFAIFSHAQENRKLIKVACVGDSITAGWGLNDPWKDSYPAVLERMLGEGYEVKNFGSSGRTLLKRGDFPYWNEKIFQDAREYRPDVVVIQLGTNDSKPQNWKFKNDFKEDYGELVDAFSRMPSNPKIYVCKPVPAYRIKWGIHDSIIRKEIIPIIEEIAKEKNARIIDLYKAFSHRENLFFDKIHPNEEGAVLMAKGVCRAIAGKEAVFGPQPYPGKKSDWNGYDMFTFDFEGRESIIVAPKKAATGTPWIWRAMFFNHEPQTDIALLEHGYHVAYIEVTHLYGGPRAIQYWNDFYDYLTRIHNFNKKTNLEGLSRAGLIVFNWAAKNPDRVASIYVDAPVCDIRSWPGKKSPLWNDCLTELRLTEEEAFRFKGNPIDNLEPIAKAGIPIVSVCGDSDVVVPYEENTAIVEKRYKELGGKILVILKPGVGHHPHSLKDPTPIVDFILQNQK